MGDMEKIALVEPEMTAEQEAELAEEYQRREAEGGREIPMDEAFPEDDE